jgi:hypothetical protein
VTGKPLPHQPIACFTHAQQAQQKLVGVLSSAGTHLPPLSQEFFLLPGIHNFSRLADVEKRLIKTARYGTNFVLLEEIEQGCHTGIGGRSGGKNFCTLSPSCISPLLRAYLQFVRVPATVRRSLLHILLKNM